jgi:transposase
MISKIQFLPPYSPELNPVEQLWQQIKQRFLSNTTFQNYDDIIERSCQAWNEILSEDGSYAIPPYLQSLKPVYLLL